MPGTEEQLEAFAAPYFVRVCREALDPWHRGRGFEAAEADYAAIAYRRGRFRLRFSHCPEDRPRFVLLATLGLAPRWFDRLARFHDMPLWRLLPEQDGSDWSFSSAEELRSRLEWLREALLDPEVEPLLGDPERLRRLIDEHERDYRERHSKGGLWNPGKRRLP